MTKGFKLPSVVPKSDSIKRTLPYNGNAVTDRHFSFSFACFDRTHKLFNLGSNEKEGSVSGSWFIELIDCFKSVNNMTITELKYSMHELHPITWSKTNANAPNEQYDYWQFRINKSKGRVIGIIIDGVFYIIWLDPHHNLTDSEGYGGVRKYSPGLSLYEIQEKKIADLKKLVKHLESELKIAERLLDEV